MVGRRGREGRGRQWGVVVGRARCGEKWRAYNKENEGWDEVKAMLSSRWWQAVWQAWQGRQAGKCSR